MKWLSILIVLIIIIGGGWYFLSQSASTPGTETSEEGMMEEQPSMSEEGVGAMPSSAEGSGGAMEDGTGMMESSDVTIELTGKNFSFSQKEIRVKKGQTVKVVFTSEGGFHDWRVDGFNVGTSQVETGGTSSVTFVADKTGEFEYYCSVGSHRQMGMVGKLIVE